MLKFCFCVQRHRAGQPPLQSLSVSIGFLQGDGLIIRRQALALATVAANPEKAGSMPQPRDLAALNSLRCSLAVLLSLRGLSSIVVSMCVSRVGALFHGPVIHWYFR